MTKDEEQPFLTDLNDGVLTLSFNRPHQGNSVPPESVPEMIGIFERAQNNPKVRCLVIRGEGKHFALGADINRFALGVAEGVDALQADFRTRMANAERLVRALAMFDRPIIAEVRGGVAGAGLLYPLVADFVIADTSCFFLFAHQRMALSPDGGVSWLLPRAVGVVRAKELLLSAARVEAEEALKLGLVSRLFEVEALSEEVGKLAGRMASAPQFAVRTAKRLVDAASSASLEDHLRAEGEGIVTAVGDPDFAEAVTSFVEKRKPDFPSTR